MAKTKQAPAPEEPEQVTWDSFFKTQYQPHDRVFQEPGSPIRTLYSSRVDADGNIVLEESGSENLYDYIQSHRDSCDINVLLARYNNGDVSALNQRQGSYGDFTQFPKTFAETLNFMIQGQDYFESLPLEVRERFGFSFERFVASMDNMDDFMKIMSPAPEGPAPESPAPESPAPESPAPAETKGE